MKVEFLVQNVKCGGCANAIQTGLSKDARVREVTVDVPTGRVSVDSEEDIGAELRAALHALGYPEKIA
ncbi:MAG: heavy metal-associated domain-containing protein [Candidatus Competibacter sp.]|nr:heavy metal-associated domain-containing protein [Candidatus Competibacter sp.]MDG4582951.1 heavy metal-associated domain-containing protein [Candidatus Competibacter sp.]